MGSYNLLRVNISAYTNLNMGFGKLCIERKSLVDDIRLLERGNSCWMDEVGEVIDG